MVLSCVCVRLSRKNLFSDLASVGSGIDGLGHPRIAEIGFVWLGLSEQPSLDAVIELAHRHSLPVIIDGAFAMPPIENLTAFSRRGVDLIAYSGGKHVGGPQASGILCGRDRYRDPQHRPQELT